MPLQPVSPVSDLPNLGQQSCKWLAAIGITTAEQLCAQDPFEVFVQLKETQPQLSLNMLYALIGAVEGMHWQQVQRERRAEILMRLDDLGLLARKPLRSTAGK
ncbi:MAG: transcriptional regulator [Rhodoferax sp.]|nr:MAG: transcriptional regulator [Rhodoferax sp.]